MTNIRRFSISNLIKPISQDDFITLCDRFKAHVEEARGYGARWSMQAYAGTPFTTTIDDPKTNRIIAERNGRLRIVDVRDMDDLLASDWGNVKYVRAILRAASAAETAPEIANIEFMGRKPKTATFFNPLGNPDLVDKMSAGHWWKRVGTGHTEHSHVTYAGNKLAEKLGLTERGR